jgi:hypothetical protein
MIESGFQGGLDHGDGGREVEIARANGLRCRT